MLTYYTYAARYRSACALPLNLIWHFETTSEKTIFSITIMLVTGDLAIIPCFAFLEPHGPIFIFTVMRQFLITTYLKNLERILNEFKFT
jgi:hypothetical protein